MIYFLLIDWFFFHIISYLYFIYLDLLKSSIAAAVSALTHLNKKNQQLALDQGLIRSIVDLLKSRNVTVQLKTARAIESLAIDNQNTQDAILSLDTTTYLMRILEKMYYVGATVT